MNDSISDCTTTSFNMSQTRLSIKQEPSFDLTQSSFGNEFDNESITSEASSMVSQKVPSYPYNWNFQLVSDGKMMSEEMSKKEERPVVHRNTGVISMFF